MRRWGGLGFDSASPSPVESLSLRYGLGSEDLLPLSNYSMRNIEESGSRSETAHGGLTGGPVSGVGSVGSESGVSISGVVLVPSDEAVINVQRLRKNEEGGGGKSSRVDINTRKKSKAKRSTKASLVADKRVYFTDSATRRLRMENRERVVVQDDVSEIDSVNSGGSVQLESIVSASHGLGAIDSGQKPELVTTM